MANEDQLPLHVGDHVQDRDDDGATLLVVGRSPQPANHYTLGEQSVADYNPDYPEDDDVVEVTFPERTDVDVSSRQTYAYPRSRLELETPLHDRDYDTSGEVTMLSGDSEIVECVACGQTGIKARIQPTACPHDSLEDDHEDMVSVARGPSDRGNMEDA